MSQIGSPDELQPHVVRRNVELDVSVEQLWELVSDPARLADWLGDAVDIDLQQGGTGAITDDGVLKFVHVDRVDSGRHLSFSWWEPDQPQHTAQVVFEVAPTPGGGSRLEITETMMTTPTTTRTASPASAQARQLQWEARVCALWACTVVAALIA
jgi:uncharacterized protein YndB with AHSA1/START domain